MTGSSPLPRGMAADWVEGRLAPDLAARAAELASSDPDFRAEVAFVHMIIAAGRDLPLVEPPPVLRQRLRQSFQDWHRSPASRASRLLEVVAALVFDSRRQQLGLAVRGAGDGLGGEAVHLMWQCELADLMLEARSTGAGDVVDLRGQVLLSHDSSSPVFTAEVVGAGRSVPSVDADGLGRFRIEAPREVTALRVSNGEMTIVAELDLTTEESA